jgi:kexin
LATTARKNDPSDADWKKNGAGLWVNHNYGFGAVDAYSAVKKAQGFTSLGTLKTKEGSESGIGDVSFSTQQTRTINISSNGINKIEHVDVWVDIDDSAVPPLKLNITLTSPSTTVSELAYNDYNDSGDGTWTTGIFDGGYRFGTARHLDESADGIWKLTINGGSGSRTFKNWKIKIYGRSN